jgi:DNA-binding Lrp family transcriptional regulator
VTFVILENKPDFLEIMLDNRIKTCLFDNKQINNLIMSHNYHELDRTDEQILELLQYDAMLTNKEIADKLGKTVTPIFERRKKLEQLGYILRYAAVLDRFKVNKGLLSFTNVQLKEHAHVMLKTFERSIIKFDEVLECHHMTGMFDYLLKVAVNDMNEYQQFIVNKLSRLPNIGTVQSSFVMTEIKNQPVYKFRN